MISARSARAIAAALLAGLGLWLAFAPKSEPASRRPAALVEEAPEAPLPAAPSAIPPPRSSPAPLRAPLARTLNVVGPGPDDPHEPGMVPHPLDEARARIDTENRLIQRLNDAMSFRNVKDMRAMLVTYRNLDPRDVDKNQLGYGIIADCIESPGDASLSAARAFYDTERHSSLRRFVRRICFENAS